VSTRPSIGDRRADPRHYRGHVDIVINGSFWVGAVGGALLTIPLLDPRLSIPRSVGGWRSAVVPSLP
jgi:hypothetical protein